MKLAVQLAAVLGFLGVALGAFGAHKLKDILTANNTLAIWQTAVLYQLIHAVASLWAAERNPMVVWLWAVGTLFFSGSLYVLALTSAKWVWPFTPAGGLFFLAGWVLIVLKPR
jgi:uncharacterized membrane protein YgdD (TMEM256/DUF423 family)